MAVELTLELALNCHSVLSVSWSSAVNTSPPPAAGMPAELARSIEGPPTVQSSEAGSGHQGILVRGNPMVTTTKTTTKQGRRAAAGRRNGLSSRVALEFAPGSLESELSAIGQSVPAGEWAKVPADYFANLDRYLHGLPKKR